MGDLEFLGQLIGSMSEAVDKLEEAKNNHDSAREKKLEDFILDIQRKIGGELR
jgi:hypothetical protein